MALSRICSSFNQSQTAAQRTFSLLKRLLDKGGRAGVSRPFSASASSDRGDGSVAKEGRVVVITSGKGGVGKTTTAASLGFGLANRGFKTCLIDFDMGLRNLDIHLGMERRVIFDFVHVLHQECTLKQALIVDKRCKDLHLLAASQTRDKSVLTTDGVGAILSDLKKSFDFVLCDSPAGIESGAHHAMYFADDALIVTNPELSSCRDSDKMVGFISSKSLRAEEGRSGVSQTLLVTRYDPQRVESEDMLHLDDVKDLLGLPLLGVIPESSLVLAATNLGKPVITMEGNDVSEAYQDAVGRFLGEELELRFTEIPPPTSLFQRIMSKVSSR